MSLGRIAGHLASIMTGFAGTVFSLILTAGGGGGGVVAAPITGGASLGASAAAVAAGTIVAGYTGTVALDSLVALFKDPNIQFSVGTGGSARVPKNKVPDDDSTTRHIFRDAEGHIPDTPENRALLEDVANDPANFRGIDKYGNEWYTKTQNDGSQVWVESRNGRIFEGGVNDTPKSWNPDTGLKAP